MSYRTSIIAISSEREADCASILSELGLSGAAGASTTFEDACHIQPVVSEVDAIWKRPWPHTRIGCHRLPVGWLLFNSYIPGDLISGAYDHGLTTSIPRTFGDVRWCVAILDGFTNLYGYGLFLGSHSRRIRYGWSREPELRAEGTVQPFEERVCKRYESSLDKLLKRRSAFGRPEFGEQFVFDLFQDAIGHRFNGLPDDWLYHEVECFNLSEQHPSTTCSPGVKWYHRVFNSNA